ncbi:MAG: WD40 repeat domain-containing protein, partial [Anaerolineae bacterium]|nr:WD40 repeat domain-containing protein [Anaerolineae bacterium]
ECANQMVWWQVDFDTLVGWTAEGQYGVYWLEPVSPAVQPGSATPAAITGQPGAPQVYTLPENSPAITLDNAANLVPFIDLPLGEAITGLAWSANGDTLAVTSASGIWLYDTAAFTRLPRLLSVPNGPVYDVTFSPDQVMMATAHNDGTVRLWDITTGGQRSVLRGHTQPVYSVAFNADGTRLASGGGTDTALDAIRLWDISSGAQTIAFQGHTAAVTALAFSPDGTLLASASEDRSVRLWDIVSGTPATVLSGHAQPVTDLAFKPDGTWLASASNDGTVRLWDIASGASLVLEGHADQVHALAYSPGGSILASGGGALAGAGDNAVRLWDPGASEPVGILDAYGTAPEAGITALAFSPDGTKLAFASTQGNQSTVHIWGIVP